jgi:endonuclease-3
MKDMKDMMVPPPTGTAAPVGLETPAVPSVVVASASAEPPQWRDQLRNIEAMRATRDAPVDEMGCERCADPTADPRTQRFQHLVALMLSSQTKDEVTFAATRRLMAALAPGAGGSGLGLTPEGIRSLEEGRLAELLCPVGFYRQKARFLRETSATLLSEYGGDVPDSVAGLVSLRGVGPKMAHIAMSACWNRPVGIGVDVHVARICHRLGWARSKGAEVKGGADPDPETTRRQVEEWLPREHWGALNMLFVGFGQQVCQKAAPFCSVCLNKDICPASRAKTRPKASKGGDGPVQDGE